MTDSERIEALEKQVTALRGALVGLSSGQMLALDSSGNPVVVYGAFTNTHQGGHSMAMSCDQNPHQHHYRTQSGLCACQDHPWAR